MQQYNAWMTDFIMRMYTTDTTSSVADPMVTVDCLNQLSPCTSQRNKANQKLSSHSFQTMFLTCSRWSSPEEWRLYVKCDVAMFDVQVHGREGHVICLAEAAWFHILSLGCASSCESLVRGNWIGPTTWHSEIHCSVSRQCWDWRVLASANHTMVQQIPWNIS